MRRIRLFTTAFPVENPDRRSEYAECLRRNLDCGELDEVFLFAEPGSELPTHRKLSHRSINLRPTYADYLLWISEVAGPDDVSIVANADIFFDDQVGALRKLPLDAHTVIALARWDLVGNRFPRLNYRNDSQDAWIFVGAPTGIRGDFPIGVPRCDNRFAKEVELAGYRLINPSFSIRSYHLHREIRGEYAVEGGEGFVQGPYGYVWPHNFSLPRVVWHNLRWPRYKLGWRIDRRLIASRSRIHLVKRAVASIR